MFMDYPTFAGSLGHNFVGNWFIVLHVQCNHWDIISLVTGLLYYMYNVRRFITLCNVRWDKIHEH